MQNCINVGRERDAVKTNAQGSPVLSIAGFDPSSGAGLTADLKVFSAHGLYGLACPTALTVQSTQGVRQSEPVEAALVEKMLDCLIEDIAIAGVKIGMLAGAPVVEAVTDWIKQLRAASPGVPVVLDPVVRSSSGAELLSREGLALMRSGLLPLASVITPNGAEAAALSGLPTTTRAEAEAAAHALCALGPAVVVTGGDADGSPDDFLLDADGRGRWFSGERVHTRATHGTGCAFSSALLANLVRGRVLPDAVGLAKDYVRGALLHAYPVGKGRGPMHHLFALHSET